MRAVLLILLAFAMSHPVLAQQWSRELNSWAARVTASIRPRIHHSEPLPVGVKVETQVEISLRPDGAVESFKVIKPSGIESWDSAVMEALRATERFPLPREGTVPSRLIMHFRPS